MHGATHLVFDETVQDTDPATSTHLVTMYTSLEHSDFFASATRLAFQVVVDVQSIRSDVPLSVTIQHSADGQNWQGKNVAPEVSGTVPRASFDVQIEQSADGIHWMPKTGATIHTTLSLYGPTYPPLAIDDGTSPSLGLVRLAVTLSSASGPIFATVKITVTGNNSREHEFAEQVAKFQSSHDISEYYYLCYPNGHIFSAHDFTLSQRAHLFATHYIQHLDERNFRFPSGVTCCFRPDGAFLLVKDGVVLLSVAGV